MERRRKGPAKLISCALRLSPAVLRGCIGLPGRTPGTLPVSRDALKEQNRWKLELITQATQLIQGWFDTAGKPRAQGGGVRSSEGRERLLGCSRSPGQTTKEVRFESRRKQMWL